MKITRGELIAASDLYWKHVLKLPPHLQEVCPTFKMYLVPDTYPYLYHRDIVKLSPMGVHRYQMLQSPHIFTLLTMYALQRLEASTAPACIDGNKHES